MGSRRQTTRQRYNPSIPTDQTNSITILKKIVIEIGFQSYNFEKEMSKNKPDKQKYQYK